MRWVWLMTGLIVLGAVPAMAQQTTTVPPQQAQTAQSPQRPVDYGPYTRQANKAYLGGGVILQGQPGAPPPPASAAVGIPQPPNQPPPQ